MNENNSSKADKKIKAKPLVLTPLPYDGEQAEILDGKRLEKSPTKTQPTGARFDARAKSRPLTRRSESERGVPETETPDSNDQEPLPGTAENVTLTKPLPPPLARDFRFGKWMGKAKRRRVRMGRALVAFAVALVPVAWGFFALGEAVENARIVAAITNQGVEIPAGFQTRLDTALKQLRAGDTEEALKNLLLLEEANPAISSLTYLVAIAAMQSGDAELAGNKADASIAKRERVSDSLALKAVLETQKRTSGFGDRTVRSEVYLRQAMVADAANPAPCIELATLLRYQKRDDEALQLLEAARSRLNPVDSHAVVEASLALMKLQDLPDTDLPADLNPDRDASSLFSSAYVAMRKGDFSTAASILRSGKHYLPTDFFDYLINDPALRKFGSRSELKEFYQ